MLLEGKPPAWTSTGAGNTVRDSGDVKGLKVVR
jgi:hypothetical protein